MRIVALALIPALFLIGSACGDEGADDPGAETPGVGTLPSEGGGQMFPDIIDATIEPDGDVWTVRATVSSPYDTPGRFADAWRVLDGEGGVLAVRELTHDHAAEQPFTRALRGVEIPPDTPTITIEGRDRVNGWGGTTFDLDVPSP